MSDVRYAFSAPCGMEMIIMVIIQCLKQSVFCAQHWEAHLPRDLMLVFVCHHKHECVSQGYRGRQEGEAGVK